MSRANAILLSVLVAALSPVVHAQDGPATIPQDEIDPATGLARTTVVRPLVDPARPATPSAAPGTPQLPGAGPATRPPAMPATDIPLPKPRAHIALILPTTNEAFGRLADSVRQGFMAASQAGGSDALPVHVTAIDNEGQALADACRHAIASGAVVVVAGMTRDGAQTVASSDCPRVPALALNETRAEPGRNLHTMSLSLEQEARQAALAAVSDGHRSAVIVHGPSPLARRVQEAFEREWLRAGGEARRVSFGGGLEEGPSLRERVMGARPDVVFFALEAEDARTVRPYVSAVLPVYATSLSVNPRAETIVNVDLQGVRYGEMPWFVLPDHPAVMVYPPAQRPIAVEQERLYAFGIDAYRVALALAQKERPRAPLDGVTGRLAFEGNVVTRTLAPAEIDGGRVIPQRGP